MIASIMIEQLINAMDLMDIILNLWLILGFAALLNQEKRRINNEHD